MTTPTPGLDLSEAEILSRARGMRELIREQQDESERAGRYTEAVHDRMLELGLYHLLTPRRYGGAEISLETWLKVVIEVATGDPGTGWCYCLGHSHNIQAASLFSESVQDELFADPRGYFRASHSLFPAGKAVPVEGGYRLTGMSRYQSGSPYSTHAIVLVSVEDPEGGPAHPMQAIIPSAEWTLVDDWGPEHVHGMRASGSNSVAFDDVFLTADRLAEATWAGQVPPERTGFAVHGNPTYIGSVQTFLSAELAAVAVGTARAALDEWERLARVRTAPLPPFATRDRDPLSQRLFGEATMKTDAAEAILVHAGRTIDEWSRAFTEGEPLTRSMDTRLGGLALEAGRLAAEAVESLVRSAGSSEARPGKRMERYSRDIAMFRTHAAMQYDAWMQGIGATLLGIQESAFDLPKQPAGPAGSGAAA